MSEERTYPTVVIQSALDRHRQDATSAAAPDWLVQVIGLLRDVAASVPAPVDRADVVPDYLYPH